MENVLTRESIRALKLYTSSIILILVDIHPFLSLDALIHLVE